MLTVKGGKGKCHAHPHEEQEEVLESYRLVSLDSQEDHERFLGGSQILLEYISRYVKDKKVTGNNQQRFSKNKLCFTNLTKVCD